MLKTLSQVCCVPFSHILFVSVLTHHWLWFLVYAMSYHHDNDVAGRVYVSGFGDPIHPHAPIYAAWNNLLAFLMGYPFIIAPAQSGFALRYAVFNFLQWVNEVSLVLDILLTFVVAVLVGKMGDHVEKKPLNVAKRYLSSWFIFDVLTTMPWKYVLPHVIGDTWVTTTRPVAESLDLIKIFRFIPVARRTSFRLPNWNGVKYAQRSMVMFVLLVMVWCCHCH